MSAFAGGGWNRLADPSQHERWLGQGTGLRVIETLEDPRGDEVIEQFDVTRG